MARPTLQFKNLSETQLSQYAENILVKMTENAAIFTEPDPTLAEFEASIDQYRHALAESAHRDMRQIELKNQYRDRLKEAIFNLSLYVTKVANGDRAIVLASGFIPTKAAESSGIAPQPTDFRAESSSTTTGHVKLRVKSWESAAVYQYEYRIKDSDTTWEKVVSTKATHLLSGLQSRAEYEFRVAYINSQSLLTYSPIINAFIF